MCDSSHISIFAIRFTYSEVSIIRSGHSRLIELEKKDSTGCLIDFFQKSRRGRLIETVSK